MVIREDLNRFRFVGQRASGDGLGCLVRRRHPSRWLDRPQALKNPNRTSYQGHFG